MVEFRAFDNVVQRLQSSLAVDATLIIGLCQRGCIPSYYVPMDRTPAPTVPIMFNDKFPQKFQEWLAKNPALHDGALIVEISIDAKDQAYVIHWSCRLYPPPSNAPKEPNRGSAYHSAIDFSCCKGVKAVYLISGGTTFRICNGSREHV